MKIRSVAANNRKREFNIVNWAGVEYAFPYALAEPRPSPGNRIEDVAVDRELGNEAFTYVLESGAEGTVHIEQVLEYHEDPEYMADLLTYKLSIEAQRRIEKCELSRRHIAKRLGTSVPQLYRLLDPTNTRKSMKQLVALLHILGCDVELVVRKRDAA